VVVVVDVVDVDRLCAAAGDAVVIIIYQPRPPRAVDIDDPAIIRTAFSARRTYSTAWSDVTVSVATTRSPFCGYNMA